MDLEKFIDTLPLATFNELRKVIIIRHQRHSAEIAMALEYLSSQDILIRAIESKRPECENVIAEKCKISKDIAVKVIDRYLELKKHFDEQNNKVDKPFVK